MTTPPPEPREHDDLLGTIMSRGASERTTHAEADVDYLVGRVMNAEQDAAYYKAIVYGQWPSHEDILKNKNPYVQAREAQVARLTEFVQKVADDHTSPTEVPGDWSFAAARLLEALAQPAGGEAK